MPDRLPVDSAGSHLHRLKEDRSPGDLDALQSAMQVFRQFALLEFSVPDSPESDGCLFEYGITSWTGERLFTVNLTRQFEQVDEDGDHESYLQVSYELHYPVEPEMEAIGKCAEWWFRDEEIEFDSWWESIPRSELEAALEGRSPVNVSVGQDIV